MSTNFGFSYIGLLFMVMLTVPNLFWTKHQPEGYDFTHENKLLLLCERIGQMLVTAVCLIFRDFNIQKLSPWTFTLAAAFIVMCFYECWWIRYFKSKKKLTDFYSSFLSVPVAGATLPIIAFLLLGIYGKNIWLIISVIILGIGHIGIHLGHLRGLK